MTSLYWIKDQVGTRLTGWNRLWANSRDFSYIQYTVWRNMDTVYLWFVLSRPHLTSRWFMWCVYPYSSVWFQGVWPKWNNPRDMGIMARQTTTKHKTRSACRIRWAHYGDTLTWGYSHHNRVLRRPFDEIKRNTINIFHALKFTVSQLLHPFRVIDILFKFMWKYKMKFLLKYFHGDPYTWKYRLYIETGPVITRLTPKFSM